MKTIALWIMAFVIPLTVHANPSKTQEKPRVIVVGGGISGLAAAKKLQGAHVDVKVLEAQDRLGGRLRTDRIGELTFDEGASWIHGPQGNPLSALADSAGVTTFLTKDESIVVYNNHGEKYNQNLLEQEEEKYNEILEEIGGKKTPSVSDYLKKHYPKYESNRLWRYMFSAFLEFDTGGDIDKLSSRFFYDDKAFEGEDLLVTNGYDKIIDYLSEGLQIELNTWVSHIDYSQDEIQIKTNQGVFKADYVIVTVPLGVLKKKGIQFNPPLKSKTQKAIGGLEMGSVNKFICVWDTVFWDADKQYIGYTPEEKGKFNYFLNLNKVDSNKKALMTFTFGDYSEQVEGFTDREVVDNIMDQLKVMYGDSIPEPLLMKRTQWNSNPFTYGAYSFVGIKGKSSFYKKFKQPKSTHLYFAGEHTSKPYRGTVHGAYLSGIREADRVLKHIK